MTVFDVVVAGSGPAGSSAACELARSGAQVLLIEKASLPRYKTCGGGLLNRAYQLFPSSVATAVERACYTAELNFLKEGLHFVTRRQEPILFMTMRSGLDFQLACEAQRAGVRLQEGCTVKAIQERDDGVEVESTKGRFRAKFVVAADGANSTIARQGGWDGLPNLLPALEYEVLAKESDFLRLNQTARFDFELIPEGYAWVFPKKEHLSVGVLSMRRGCVRMQEYLHRYLNVLGIKQPEKVERHGYVIPTRPRKGGLGRRRVLLTGDAAGLVDPVTAEGITYAIRSGQLAAQALRDCQFNPEKVSARYQSLVAAEIFPELQAGRILAWVLYKQSRLAAWLFRKHGSVLSELMTEVIMGRASYRGELRRLRNYLKLLRSLGIRRQGIGQKA